MTVPFLPYGTPLEGQSASDWAAAILEAMKAPLSSDNVYSLAGWFHEEGGGGQNNPMNTTLGSQYPAINSDGVRDYPTPEVGVEETVATLEDYGYSAIVASFRAGVGLGHPNAATAEELGEWSGGGYHAIVPVVVPMPPAPPAPDPYHYLWFDDAEVELPHGRNSERNVVKNYDKYRPDPEKNKEHLAVIYVNLEALIVRAKNIETDEHDPSGKLHHLAWRVAQMKARDAGQEIVKPHS